MEHEINTTVEFFIFAIPRDTKNYGARQLGCRRANLKSPSILVTPPIYSVSATIQEGPDDWRKLESALHQSVPEREAPPLIPAKTRSSA